MTVCVIKVCRNYKGRSKTTKKVTYHRIPNDPVLRSRWIDIIRKSRGEELWKPAKNSVVCSEHFHRKDKYFVNNQGRLRLKKGTLPRKALFLSSLESDGSDVSDEDDTFKETEPIDNVEAGAACNIKTEHLSSLDRETPSINVEAGPSGIVRAEHLSSLELDDTADAENVTCHWEDAKNTSNKTENETDVIQDFSDLDSIFDTPKEVKLRRELRKKITLQKKHTLKIQSLRRKNIRLKKKLDNLKSDATSKGKIFRKQIQRDGHNDHRKKEDTASTPDSCPTETPLNSKTPRIAR